MWLERSLTCGREGCLGPGAWHDQSRVSGVLWLQGRCSGRRCGVRTAAERAKVVRSDDVELQQPVVRVGQDRDLRHEFLSRCLPDLRNGHAKSQGHSARL